MGVRRNIVIAATAGAVAVGVVAATAAATAAPAVVNHTIKLVATQTASHQFSSTTASAAETDRHDGKVIGYDVLAERFSKTSQVIFGAFDTQGGLMYFRIPLTNTKTLHGKITGGAGRFAGIQGTIAATSLNKANTRTAVTIVWHH